MEKHLRLLGVLYIVYGSLHILGGVAGWIFLRWSGMMHGYISQEAAGAFVLASGIVAVLILFLMLVSAAGIIGGVGLLNKKRWARVLVLVLSFLNLIHFPLGTALGAYGIWVLMNDKTDKVFTRGADPASQQRIPASR